MPFKAPVDSGDKLLCADDAAVGEIPGPVPESVNTEQIKACPVQFTYDSAAYFTGRIPQPEIHGKKLVNQKINTEILSYQAAKVRHYGQGSPPAISALEDQRLEAFSAIKKFAFADKSGELSENRMIFPLDFFLVLWPLFSINKAEGEVKVETF